jgi:hypothetical protein
LAKRQFTIDTGKEQIPVEGQVHRNVAVKYLMKRRRSLLMTKNSEKVEKLWQDLPKKIKIIGKQVTKEYTVKWERLGQEEFEGSRFAFTLEDQGERSNNNNNNNGSFSTRLRVVSSLFVKTERLFKAILKVCISHLIVKKSFLH